MVLNLLQYCFAFPFRLWAALWKKPRSQSSSQDEFAGLRGLIWFQGIEPLNGFSGKWLGLEGPSLEKCLETAALQEFSGVVNLSSAERERSDWDTDALCFSHECVCWRISVSSSVTVAEHWLSGGCSLLDADRRRTALGKSGSCVLVVCWCAANK